MAAPKKEELDEIKKLLSEINNYYSKIGEKNPFASFDTKNIKDASNAIDQLNIGLKDAKKRFDELTDGAQNLYAQLKASVQELSKTNTSVKDSIRSYTKLGSIAQQLRDDQKGINDLNEKDLKSMQAKIQSEVENLRIATESAELRKKDLIYKAQNAKITGGLTKQERDEYATLNKTIASNNNLLKDQENIVKDLTKQVEERLELEKKINKQLGLSGAIIGSFKKFLPGPLADALKLDDAMAKMREAAKEGKSKFAVMFVGIKEMGKGLAATLTDPLTIITAIVKTFKFFLDAALKVNSQIVDIGKSMGIGAKGAEAIRDKMKEVRDTNNDIYLSVTNQIEAQNELADAFGTTGMFSEQMIKDQIALTKKIGLSTEEASAFSVLAKSNNQTQLEATILVGKQVQSLTKQKGIMLDTRKVMAEVAKVQGQLRLQYGNSTEQLAKAVVLSKSLGMTFEQANSAAKKLLDFESSISNELEAELLTGKDLNLEEARKLALMGKTAEAQALIMEQVGSAAEFANMNVFAQESLAAAAGMTADELANSLVQQENLNKLGTEQRANLEAMVKDLRSKGEIEAANDLLAQSGDATALAAIMTKTSAQQEFNQLIDTLKEMLGDILEGPMRGVIEAIQKWSNGGGNLITTFNTIKDTIESTIKYAKILAAIYVGLKVTNLAIAASMAIQAARSRQQAIASSTELGKQIAITSAWVVANFPASLIAVGAGVAAAGTLYSLMDGGIDPNGGLVISKPKGDMIVPIAQGVKEDYAYLSTNKPQDAMSKPKGDMLVPPSRGIKENNTSPVKQTSDAVVTPMSAGTASPQTQNFSELIDAMKVVAYNTSVSAKKEFDFDTFGTTVATKQVGISA
jgi:hypothetical protein